MTSRSHRNARCPYCARRKPWAGETDLATVFPNLAAQWHPTKNGTLTPSQVLPGSNRKVWWVCELGHEWSAEIKSRADGCGCPVCKNRMNLPGSNDLASIYPDIAAQWHPSKNGKLRPQDVMAGSHKKVWWRCKMGHEWKAQIASRTYGAAECPFCAGKIVIAGKNDLATLAPNIAAQWNYKRNGTLTPEQVSAFSNRIVWWQCALGHEWRSIIEHRTAYLSGCPYCSGKRVLAGFNDLATLCPEIAAQWYQPLNGGLTPQMVTPGSRKKTWWQCSVGHVWKAAIYARTGSQKTGCPVCAGHVNPRTKKFKLIDNQ